MKKMAKALACSVLGAAMAGPGYAGNVEVLHYWTSGGEAEALSVLKEMLESEGHSWTDFAVSGGGGETAMTVLKARAISGNPPSASMIAGPEIQQWSELGVLSNIDNVADAEGWDSLLPAVVSNIHKSDGHYVAVPVNVHRINWMWINKKILDEVNAGETPNGWDSFFSFLDKAKAAGYTAFAHGGQDWQDATVFEQVALGTGGTEWYKKAFIDLDQEALKSETMVKALATFKKLKEYMDEGMPGRDWNLSTAMVIEGKAAVQIMGDWAKGEFTSAGKKPGVDYVCAAVPGTTDSFTFNIDAFMMFKQKGDDKKAQESLARLLMSQKFQEEFNLKKGSIPVRSDVSLDRYDSCALLSNSNLKDAVASGNLVPSFSHAMAMQPQVSGAVYDVVTNYFNDSEKTAEKAAMELATAIQAAI